MPVFVCLCTCQTEFPCVVRSSVPTIHFIQIHGQWNCWSLFVYWKVETRKTWICLQPPASLNWVIRLCGAWSQLTKCHPSAMIRYLLRWFPYCYYTIWAYEAECSMLGNWLNSHAYRCWSLCLRYGDNVWNLKRLPYLWVLPLMCLVPLGFRFVANLHRWMRWRCIYSWSFQVIFCNINCISKIYICRWITRRKTTNSGLGWRQENRCKSWRAVTMKFYKSS